MCPLCRFPATGDTVRPGPAFGVVHRVCFAAWDRTQEAHEMISVLAAPYEPEPHEPRSVA